MVNYPSRHLDINHGLFVGEERNGSLIDSSREDNYQRSKLEIR